MAGCTLALDQGSQSSRAIVYSPGGELLAEAKVPVSTQRYEDADNSSRVEQDGAEIVESLKQAIAIVAGQTGPAAIGRVGIATQRSSVVVWNRASGEAVTPVLSWQDRRAAAWLEGFEPQSHKIQSITGLLLSPHYGVSKIRWLMDNDTAVAAGIGRGDLIAGPLSSFILCNLLSEKPLLVDPANAGRTLLYDHTVCDWSDDLLAMFGILRSSLPVCVPSAHSYGRLQLHGVDAPLLLCNGDQSSALFAFGPARTDTAYANLGTGAFFQRPVGRAVPHAEGLLSSIVFSNGDETDYVLEGTVNGSGSALNTVADELGLSREEVNANLTGWLGRCVNPPLFLNGVSGLGAPWWIPDFPSQFVGEGSDEEKMVAVLESIIFLLHVNFDVAKEVAGMPERWIVTGGLAAVDGVCQKLADLSRIPVARPEAFEATALGVAQLLNLGNEAFKPVITSSCGGEGIQPETNKALDERYARWHYAMSEVINNSYS